jgi:hypothetical protein
MYTCDTAVLYPMIKKNIPMPKKQLKEFLRQTCAFPAAAAELEWQSFNEMYISVT